jgi:chloramphenicol 3-O-phosphotransferase
MNLNHDLGKIDTFLTIDTTAAPPLGGLTNSLQVLGNGAVYLPYGTTLQRPANSQGMIRYNTDLSVLEYNNGTAWFGAGGSVTSVALTSDSTTSSALTIVSGSPITGAGTIHLALGAELVGLAGLAATGLLVHTGAGTYTEATITGTAGNITLSNGNGVAGNPTINLATVTQGATGTSFVKVQLDTFGRVINNTAVVAADITGALTYTPVNKAGDSMASAANLTFSGGGTVTGLPTPVNASDAAPKSYVDASASGITIQSAVEAASTAALTVTYTAGTADANSGLGIGAILTNAGAQAIFSIDGYAAAVNARVLIKNQATATQNGIYTVTNVGSVSTNWVLTRATDYNNSVAGQVHSGDFVWVSEGSTQANTGWVETGIGTYSPGDITIIGTNNITFAQFSGAGTYAGTTNQITLTGTVFSLSTTIVTPGAFTASPVSANVVLSPTGTGVVTIGPATLGSLNNMTVGATVASTGAFTTLGATSTVTLSPASANVVLSPTGTGVVTINPATLGSIDNVNVGATTAGTGRFTTVQSTVATGTAPFTVTSTTPVTNLSIGGNAATATTATNANNIAITAVTTNAAFYLTFVSASTGTLALDVDTGLTFNPSTNILTTTGFAGTLNGTVGAVTPASGAFTTLAASITVSGTGFSTYLASPPAIGGTVAAAGAFTTLTGTGTISLSPASLNVTISPTGTGTVTISPAGTLTLGTLAATTTLLGNLSAISSNQTITLSPTGTGTVAISPVGALTVNPTAASTINNASIGVTTPLAGSFTALSSNTSVNIGNGFFTTLGDARQSVYVLRNITTTATPTLLYLNGSSTLLVLRNNSVYTFSILVAGRRTDAVGDGAGYRIEGAIRQDTTAASTTLIGAVSQYILGETTAAWNATVTADVTNGSLNITVTGEAAKTIRWVATVTTCEVTN